MVATLRRSTRRPRPLPLQVNTERDYPEETRLKYRFLDLRREKMQRNIVLRSQMIASIRRRMHRAGLHRVPDADPDRLVARGCARLPGAVAAASRQVLRPAAGAAAVQAALHDLRLRPVLPDRPLLSRRGRPRRPQPGRVLPARHRDELRHPGGRVRRGRAGDARPVHRVLRLGGDADAVPAHHLRRGHAALRHRQAGPAQPGRRSPTSPRCSAARASRCSRVRSSRVPWSARCRRPARSAGRAASSTRWWPSRRAWARPGLGWVALADGEAKGPIAKFLDAERLAALRAAAGLARRRRRVLRLRPGRCRRPSSPARCAPGSARSWG